MANYTMTLAEMRNNPLTPIFPSSYPFYTDDEQIRKTFENKFISHYLNREIGFETPFQFKQMLYAKLTVNMDYWKKLYETEMKSNEMNFLLNKDLRETFIRTIDENGESSHRGSTSLSSQSSGDSTNRSNTSNLETLNTNSLDTNKQSSVNDGLSRASLDDGYLTLVNEHNNTTNQNSTTTQDTNNTSSSSTNVNNSEISQLNGESSKRATETTELISQGNIGVTSTAELLQKWRDCIVNIDKLIIDECKDLFMQIY